MVLKVKVFVTVALLLVRSFMKDALELVTPVSRLAPSLRNFLSLLGLLTARRTTKTQ